MRLLIITTSLIAIVGCAAQPLEDAAADDVESSRRIATGEREIAVPKPSEATATTVDYSTCFWNCMDDHGMGDCPSTGWPGFACVFWAGVCEGKCAAIGLSGGTD